MFELSPPPAPSVAAIYGGTSSTSNAIASSGSKTFTVQAGLAYVVGTRLRFADTSDPTTNWMEGIVTAYSGTTLTATMDLAAGSGTLTAWTISLAGARGATGAPGAQGDPGDPGAQGDPGPAWEPTPSTFVADPTGGAIQDAESRTAIAAILDILIAQGLMAAS